MRKSENSSNTSNFSSNNLKNFKRNRELKGKLNTMDFNQLTYIIKDLKEIDEKEINNKSNTKIFLESIANEIRTKLFNVNGIFKSINNKINREKELEGIYLKHKETRLDLTLTLLHEDEDIKYLIEIKRIKIDSYESILKYTNNAMVYITNLKATFNKIGDSVGLKLSNRSQTKIYARALNYSIMQMSNEGNSVSISKILEIENEERFINSQIQNSQDSTEKNLICILNKNNSHHRNNKNDSPIINQNIERKSISNSKIKTEDLIDLTKDNEWTFIDIFNSEAFRELMIKIPKKFRDFSHLLEYEVDTAVINMNKFSTFTKLLFKKVDLCGFVENYKDFKENNTETINCVSLKNSNFIKIHHNYENDTKFDLLENCLVLFKSINLRVNNNLEIVLDSPQENFIKVIAKIDDTDVQILKKFRFDKNKDFDSLINLTHPTIVRRIKKYLVTITKIISLNCGYEKTNYEISEYPHLKLWMYCKVDDGSCEAFVKFENNLVIKLLEMKKEAKFVILKIILFFLESPTNGY